MLFPDYRARRLREKPNFRKMIQENRLFVDDLILPLFAVEGKGIKKPIDSMPGQFHFSCDMMVKIVKEAYSLGIPAVMIFGLPDKKDPLGTQAYAA
ncbi:MAG: porphobilinogen synthase, partial [Desulfobacteraceae bacterium]